MLVYATEYRNYPEFYDISITSLKYMQELYKECPICEGQHAQTKFHWDIITYSIPQKRGKKKNPVFFWHLPMICVDLELYNLYETRQDLNSNLVPKT